VANHNRRRHKSKADQSQYRLPFDQWKERFSALDAISHDRVGLTRPKWRNVRAYLKAIHHFDRNGDGCWASETSLCERADLTVHQLRPAKKTAIERKLIEVKRRNSNGYGGHGRAPDLISINWPAVFQSQPSGPGQPLASKAPDQNESNTVFPNSSADFPNSNSAFLDSNAEKPRYIEEEVQSRNSNKYQPPPTSPKRSPIDTGGDATWSVVVEELFRNCGVNQAKPTCEAARRCGVTAAEVQSLIRYWQARRKAWGRNAQAVLVMRIKRAQPRQPSYLAWPDYCQDAPRIEAKSLDETERQQRHASQEGLRQRFGEFLEQLSVDQKARLVELVNDRYPYLGSESVDGKQRYREGILPLANEVGEQGIHDLLAAEVTAPLAVWPRPP